MALLQGSTQHLKIDGISAMLFGICGDKAGLVLQRTNFSDGILVPKQHILLLHETHSAMLILQSPFFNLQGTSKMSDSQANKKLKMQHTCGM